VDHRAAILERTERDELEPRLESVRAGSPPQTAREDLPKHEQVTMATPDDRRHDPAHDPATPREQCLHPGTCPTSSARDPTPRLRT
jgi:hypothetical protein